MLTLIFAVVQAVVLSIVAFQVRAHMRAMAEVRRSQTATDERMTAAVAELAAGAVRIARLEWRLDVMKSAQAKVEKDLGL